MLTLRFLHSRFLSSRSRRNSRALLLLVLYLNRAITRRLPQVCFLLVHWWAKSAWFFRNLRRPNWPTCVVNCSCISRGTRLKLWGVIPLGSEAYATNWLRDASKLLIPRINIFIVLGKLYLFQHLLERNLIRFAIWWVAAIIWNFELLKCFVFIWAWLRIWSSVILLLLQNFTTIWIWPLVTSLQCPSVVTIIHFALSIRYAPSFNLWKRRPKLKFLISVQSGVLLHRR